MSDNARQGTALAEGWQAVSSRVRRANEVDA